MFCDQCGSQIDRDARFCDNCGLQLEPNAASDPSPPDVEQRRAGSAPVATAAVVDPRPPADAMPDRLRTPVWVVPDADETTLNTSRFSSRPLHSTRNKVSGPVMWLYAGGVVLACVGIYLATITRITTNLITGHTTTSNPDLGIGVALIAVGVVAAGAGKLIAKQQLRT